MRFYEINTLNLPDAAVYTVFPTRYQTLCPSIHRNTPIQTLPTGLVTRRSYWCFCRVETIWAARGSIDNACVNKFNRKLSRSPTHKNKLTCAPIEDSDQPGFRAFALRFMGSQGHWNRTSHLFNFLGCILLQLN